MVFGFDLVWPAIDRELCRSEITVHTYIHTYMYAYMRNVYICTQIAGLKVEQNWPGAAVEHASVKPHWPLP